MKGSCQSTCSCAAMWSHCQDVGCIGGSEGLSACFSSGSFSLALSYSFLQTWGRLDLSEVCRAWLYVFHQHWEGVVLGLPSPLSGNDQCSRSGSARAETCFKLLYHKMATAFSLPWVWVGVWTPPAPCTPLQKSPANQSGLLMSLIEGGTSTQGILSGSSETGWKNISRHKRTVPILAVSSLWCLKLQMSTCLCQQDELLGCECAFVVPAGTSDPRE